ncbi:MAG: MFS transporter [Rhizobiaceae bacterium]
MGDVLPEGTPVQSGTFAAFKHRNYRLLWAGNLISNSGDWLDQVALNWLVISTTDSPVYLGLVNMARGLPLVFFALVGGVVADMVDRRLLLMITQSCAMLFAVLLAVLVYMGDAPIWAILLLATGRGIVIAFNTPARHSLISELVPRHDLPSAVALNSVVFNISKVIGPLLAAAIISAFGTAACFLANALSFTVVLVMLLMIRLPAKAVRAARRESFLASMTQGVRYVRNDSVLLLLVLVALVPTFFAQPYLQLLAMFAHDVFHVGSTGLGVMVSVAATGSIAGGLFAAWVQREARTGSAMLLFMGGFGLALMLFSMSPSYALAIPLLFLAGAMHIAYNSSNNTVLQMTTDDAYRGRVLSILFTARGLVSLGTAATATLAAFAGARASMALMAGVVVLFAIVLWTRAPRLRNLRV